METKIKRQWSIPLIFSYVGSIAMYTTFEETISDLFIMFSTVIIVGLLIYSLYIIWQKYSSKDRTKWFVYVAIFSLLLHAVIIPTYYYFQGIIAFLAGLVMIYLFFKKIIKV